MNLNASPSLFQSSNPYVTANKPGLFDNLLLNFSSHLFGINLFKCSTSGCFTIE